MVRAAAALAVLLALVAGIPGVLLLAGPELPTHLPTFQQIHAALARPDDGHLFLVTLAIAGWVGWAAFVLSLLVEVAARLLGRRPPRIVALTWAQRGTGILVSAMLAALPVGVAVASPGPAHPASTATSPVTGAPDAQRSTGTVLPARVSPHHDAWPAVRTYRVRPHDSLWRIAERELGDPRRYTEIAAANAGRDMGDGRRFDPDGFLQPGWILCLPDGSGAVHADRLGGERTHIVVPGDTLWEIAGIELGDPTRYPEIVELNRGMRQPDGRVLTDPDVILPGWHLALPPAPRPTAPASPPQARPPVPTPPPGGSDSRPEPHLPAPPTEATSPSPEEAGGGHASRPAAARAHHSSPVVPYGLLLATGVAASLVAKRRIQQRRRRPGRRIAMPEMASDAELAMRADARPVHVDLLDRAMRSLSSCAFATGAELPELAAARVAPNGTELLLAEPAEAVPPFEAVDGLTWRLDPTDTALLDGHDLAGVPAAYPALVGIGHDREGSLWLVDLEHAGPVHLAGDGVHVCEILTALALELATSPLAEGLDVTCVGFGEDLPQVLEAGRLRHAPDVATALDALDRPTHAGIRLPAGDARRYVLLSAIPPTEEQRERLAAATALVAPFHDTPPRGGWVLDATPGAEITVHDRSGTVTLQRLTDEEYQQLVADLRTAGEAEGPPGWHDVPSEPADPPDREDDPPPQANPGVPRTREAAPTTFHDVPDGDGDDREAPEVRVLGRVEVAGRDPTDVEPGKRNLLCELASYLALNPGRSADEVSRAMGGARAPWSPSTRASNMSRLRAWFGKDPDGRNYVVAQGDQGALYTLLDSVRCDWHRFQELAQRGLARDPDGTPDLRAALDLVRGQPFSNAGIRYIWAEYAKQDMISAIVDVVHTLAVRAIKAGDPAKARSAIARGLEVEPGSELLYRDLFRAEHRAGNVAGIADAARRLTVINDQLGVEMEPDTAHLLDRLLPGGYPRRGRPVSAVR